MVRALDVIVIQVEELILLPFECGTRVWAAVDIGKKLTVLVYDEQGSADTVIVDLEAFAARIRNLVNMAK